MESNTRTEHVLVVESRVLDGMTGDVLPYLDIGFNDILSRFLAPMHMSFLPRQNAEVDTRYRQVIPYVLVRSDDRILSYSRTSKGGESRLHGLRSIGWGGHVELSDVVMSQNQLDVWSTLRSCARREIREELGIANVEMRRYIGLIIEDKTAVGRVHLGCVEVWDVDSGVVENLEDKSDELRWATVADLWNDDHPLESWSEQALGLYQRCNEIWTNSL